MFAVLEADNRTKLPRWAQIALSAAFALVQLAFGASVAFVGGAYPWLIVTRREWREAA